MGIRMRFLLIRTAEIKNGKPVIPFPLSHPPLGLLYIASEIEQEGHTVEILDYQTDSNAPIRLEKASESTDAVGITLTTDQIKPVAHLTSKIKAINSELPIIIGGPHCTILPKQTLSDIKDADMSVIGDGEPVILEIIKWLQGYKELSDIQGIYYRENNQIKQGKSPHLIDKLDGIPFPARHLIERNRYGVSPWGFTLKNKVTSIATSRGCPFECRFCANNTIKTTQKYRQRSAEDVFKEIQQVGKEYRSIIIVDDNFLADKTRAHQIFDLIIDSGVKVNFIIEGARVDSADNELYSKMKQAGVTTILYGVESGNQDVLDYYHKGITLTQIRTAVNLAHKMHFFVYASFILGAPIETKKHIDETIKFACSLPIDFAIFGPLRYQAGSPLWTEAVNEKKIQDSQYNVIADKNLGLSEFTAEELTQYSINGFISFYFRPKYMLHQLYQSIIHRDINLFLNGVKFYTLMNKW
jgi:anaerobic magnesium-protoporphyrin IX monomethyl ester cyclase